MFASGTTEFVWKQLKTCLMQCFQEIVFCKKYATRAEHSFLTTRGPSFIETSRMSHDSSLSNTAVLLDPNEALPCNQRVLVRTVSAAYQSVLILIVKVRAPKNRTLESWLCSNASARAQPSGDLWMACRAC